MSTKTLLISPTERGFTEAARWLEQYAQDLERKCNELISKMTREGEDYAINALGHIETGDTLNSVIGYRDGEYGIISVGGAAIWIEFGTGTTYNSDLHPKAADMNMSPHGTYGNGFGNADEYPDGWFYFDEKQQRWRMTKGIPQNRFMYNTAQMLRREYKRMIEEVFK